MTDIVSSFARSLQLIQASGKVLRSDPELLILPVISGIATVFVGAALVWPAFAAGIFPPLEDGEPVGPLSPAFYVWLFVFYFVEYFVIIFFNTALIGAAIARLEGGNPTVGSAIALAWSRILPIIGYAFVSATFGLLLRMIAEKLGFLGRLIEFGAGLAWTVATFLVVPVLAVEGVGPLRAIERSGTLLNETWGENLIGSGGISVITGLIAFVVALAFGGGVFLYATGQEVSGILLGTIAGMAFIAVIVISSALASIYAGAVYYFAFTGNAPYGFDNDLIRGSFSRKEPKA